MYQQFDGFPFPPMVGADAYLATTGLDELQKALTSTYETDIANFAQGDALRVQFLESMLRDVTFRDGHAKLW